MRVLVAGIGGASLGTEILKCLRMAGTYEAFGCDVSPYAFGHYQEGTVETFVVPTGGYVDAVAELCRRLGRTADARASYGRALALARQEPERRFLERRLAELSGSGGDDRSIQRSPKRRPGEGV